MIQVGDWVLCHIFLKIGSSAETVDEEIQQPMFSHDSSPTSSSSSSSSFSGTRSVITHEVSSSYGSDCEETSGRN